MGPDRDAPRGSRQLLSGVGADPGRTVEEPAGRRRGLGRRMGGSAGRTEGRMPSFTSPSPGISVAHELSQSVVLRRHSALFRPNVPHETRST
jgi:hypothetical protein